MISVRGTYSAVWRDRVKPPAAPTSADVLIPQGCHPPGSFAFPTPEQKSVHVARLHLPRRQSVDVGGLAPGHVHRFFTPRCGVHTFGCGGGIGWGQVVQGHDGLLQGQGMDFCPSELFR